MTLCESAKRPPCSLKGVQQTAPFFLNFHGNHAFHHTVILDRRLRFTLSAICLSNMEDCFVFGGSFFAKEKKNAFEVGYKSKVLAVNQTDFLHLFM